MSYSRWGGRGSGYWFTYWLAPVRAGASENRDSAVFDVATVAAFTARELRDDMDRCMVIVQERDSVGDIDELRRYAMEFLADVDRQYSSGAENGGVRLEK